MNWNIIRLSNAPELTEQAVHWFHEKWKVPEEAYRESIQDSQKGTAAVPQWYVAVEDGQIIGGLGVIENDFHKRKDLAPNICAVYVEPPYRMKGLSRTLMDTACADLAAAGIETVYLITTHTQYYEHCGWSFYGMIEEDDDSPIRMYQRRTR